MCPMLPQNPTPAGTPDRIRDIQTLTEVQRVVLGLLNMNMLIFPGGRQKIIVINFIEFITGMGPRDGAKMGGGAYGGHYGAGGGGWSGGVGGRGGMEMPNLQTLGLGGGAGGTGQGQGMNNPMGLGALNLGKTKTRAILLTV